MDVSCFGTITGYDLSLLLDTLGSYTYDDDGSSRSELHSLRFNEYA